MRALLVLAVIGFFAQLVDDPSARPEEFPTEEDQLHERERLHGIIERLVDWDNVRDEKLLADLKSKGMQVTTPERAAFEKATADVTDKWTAGPVGPYVKKVIGAARPN